MSKATLSNLFSGQQENVLLTVLQELAKEQYGDEGHYAIYAYLNHTPQTSLVVEIVEKMNEIGYSIQSNK